MDAMRVDMTAAQVAEIWLARYGSANTRLAYGSDLRSFLAWWDEPSRALTATADELDEYRRDRVTSGISDSTLDRQTAALRAFYEAAWELGVCTTNPLGSRPSAAPVSSSTGLLSADESDRLRSVAFDDPRTAVLVQLLLEEGLRLSEVLAIDHPDVCGSRTAKRVRVRRHGRDVTVALDRDSSRAVARLQRPSPAEGPLLISQPHRGGRPSRLTRFGADQLLKLAAATAGVASTVSANVLRRTHAAKSQLAGVHINDIQLRMGHRDVRTTRRYLRPESTPPST